MEKELIENCTKININELFRTGQITKADIVNNDFLTIEVRVPRLISTDPLYRKAKLYFSPRTSHFGNKGGIYWALQCPKCHRTVMDYYCPPFSLDFLCRHCHNLAYSSTNLHKNRRWESHDKYLHKLKKVEKKLKNKRLRTFTKQNLLYEYKHLMKMTEEI
ncbi:MAG: hypothetical protein ISS45_07870 [Candidatus Omnitrophica bacterium]|nr:hypothetical protein [Candidatus Omnitrophota bacterium]